MNTLRIPPIMALLGLAAVMGMMAWACVGRGPERTRVVLDGLQAPRGLTPLDDGSVLVAEVLGGRLLHLDSNGELSVVAEGLPATYGGPGERYPTGISAAVRVDGACYYIVGEFRGNRYSTLYRLEPGGEPEAVAGGVGLDGFPTTRITNPYDLVPAPGGGFYVSDGGANAVLHVTPDGEVLDYADFPRRENPEGGRFSTMDVVPTGLAYGADGALYLASLTGFPYPRGAARVYRLEDRNGDGDALDDGETTVYADGFTAATDLAFLSDGSLLVTEFSGDMRRLSDLGLDRAADVPGRLVRWREGKMEVVAEGLVSPTAVAVSDGRILVSEEFAGRVVEVLE